MRSGPLSSASTSCIPLDRWARKPPHLPRPRVARILLLQRLTSFLGSVALCTRRSLYETAPALSAPRGDRHGGADAPAAVRRGAYDHEDPHPDAGDRPAGSW